MRKKFNRYDRYIKRITTAFDMLDKIEAEMEAEILETSNVDKELSDYMHIIEDDETKITNPKNFLAKMGAARRRRREIKVIKAVLHRYRQLSNRMNNPENRKMMIAELYKEVKQQQQEYKFRVIDEEEALK